MDTKLTLKLNEQVIERAKVYARRHNTSLSKLIESYLNLLTRREQEPSNKSPLVDALSGVIRLEDNI